MQAKQDNSRYDWHQSLLLEQLKTPLIETRAGFAFTSIGHLLKFNLSEEFPVTKAKKLFIDQVERELYCWLKGYASKKKLHEHGVHIWDANMEAAGADNLGEVYGKCWRMYAGCLDQLQWAIDGLKKNPWSRRAVVTAWDPIAIALNKVVIPSCHCMFQFNIVGDTLYTDVYQRSADLFLGLPFDVASFAILSRLVVNELHLPGDEWKEVLNYHIANLHLYKEHEQAAAMEIMNEPRICQPFYESYGQGINNFDYTKAILLHYPETRVIKAKMLV